MKKNYTRTFGRGGGWEKTKRISLLLLFFRRHMKTQLNFNPDEKLNVCLVSISKRVKWKREKERDRDRNRERERKYQNSQKR